MKEMDHPSRLCWLYFATAMTLNGVQGLPDLSAPTHAIEYHGYHISIFKDISVPPTFYYTPACFLLSNDTIFTTKDTGPRYVTIKIGLWEEVYTQHIRSYLAATDGVLSPHIRPIPFKWMRIDTIDNWRNSQFLSQWKSIANQPKTITFRIRCLTSSACNKMEESRATDNGHFASNIQLAFAYSLPNTTKSHVRIQREHVQTSQTFQTLNVRYPEVSFVYVQKSIFDDLVQEVLKESVMSSLLHDEFVDDEQIDGLLKEYSRKLQHSITSTAQFTESMWNVTFWTDESQRPDAISFKLWCVALGILREKTDFGVSPIWTTKRTADYLTAAHFASRNSDSHSRNVIADRVTVSCIPSSGSYDPSGHDTYQPTRLPVPPLRYYPELEGRRETTTWTPYWGGASARGHDRVLRNIGMFPVTFPHVF